MEKEKLLKLAETFSRDPEFSRLYEKVNEGHLSEVEYEFVRNEAEQLAKTKAYFLLAEIHDKVLDNEIDACFLSVKAENQRFSLQELCTNLEKIPGFIKKAQHP